MRLIAGAPGRRVYEAVDGTGSRVALKERVFALAPDAQHLEAFGREGRLLEQLSHPGIPKFVTSFAEGDGVDTRFYLAQEYVDGVSLLEEVSRGPLSEETAREVASQVLEILFYLHDRSPRIVHRDVKPSNLLRRSDGKVVLVDFGTARDLNSGGTTQATLAGTFGYMPPEQLGGTVDPTADLYALGATLLHLTTGTSPAETMADRFDLDLSQRAPGSARFKRFLRKLLAPRISDRFTSAMDAYLALHSPDGGGQPRRRRPAAVGALAACGLIAVGWFAWDWRAGRRAADFRPSVIANYSGSRPPVAALVHTATSIPALPQTLSPRSPNSAIIQAPLRARWLLGDPTDGRVVRDETGRYPAQVKAGWVALPNDAFDGLQQGSLAFWLKAKWSGNRVLELNGRPRGPGDENRLLTLRLVGGGEMEYDTIGQASILSGPLQPEVAHHFALTWSAKGRDLYLDGVRVAKDSAAALLPAIGTAAAYSDGYLDDLRVYEAPLAAEDALALWDEGSDVFGVAPAHANR